jgi:hypothetical protein
MQSSILQFTRKVGDRNKAEILEPETALHCTIQSIYKGGIVLQSTNMETAMEKRLLSG